MSWLETAIPAAVNRFFPKPGVDINEILGPAVPGAPAGLGSAAQNDAFARVQQVLTDYDLASLSGQVWDWIVQGRSEIEVVQMLRQTQEFKTRFRAIEERQKKGLPALSPGEVVSFERQARAIMRSAGLPEGFYDQPDDYVNLLVNDVSPRELEERVNSAYVRVAQAPASIQRAFTEFYGAQGQAGLAAYALDPDRAMPLLLRQVAAAEASGLGRDFGFDLNQSQAERIAQAGVQGDQTRRGFQQLATVRDLFTETISEAEDLTAGDQGAEAVFGLGGSGAQDMERRRQERAGAFSGGSGSASSQTGFYGLGSARS